MFLFLGIFAWLQGTRTLFQFKQRYDLIVKWILIISWLHSWFPFINPVYVFRKIMHTRLDPVYLFKKSLNSQLCNFSWSIRKTDLFRIITLLWETPLSRYLTLYSSWGPRDKLIMCKRAESLQSCLTLWDPMVCSPQAPLSMGFSRQEYWSGLPCSSPGDLPNPGIKPSSLPSPSLSGRFFTTSAAWEAQTNNKYIQVAKTFVKIPMHII